MTIKQQGGVFGRNPTFNNVDVEGNLDVGGTVTHTGTQNITGQLNVDNLRLDGNTISSTNTDGSIILDANGTGIVDAKDRVRAQIQSGATNNTQPDAITVSNITTGAHAAGLGSSVRFEYANSGGGYAGPRIAAESLADPFGADLVFYGRYYGDVEGPRVKAITGNLAFPSGKGIDFSATSGTGTSELFDDYEEGTWTPQLYDSSSTGGNASPTSGTGFYTKVGNTVTVWCSFSNISTSGMTAGNNVWVHGFPYSNGTAEGIGAVNCDTLNFGAGKTNVVVLVYPSNALALLKQTGDNVSDANTIVSDISSGTTDIVFTVTYKV